MELTPDFIKKAIGGNYQNRTLCVELANRLKTHAKGNVPERLIFERRPSESEEIKNYRKKIYVPKTRNPISKVISSLEKIRRSQDWNIQYDNNALQRNIAESETLERYCEYDYPHFTSITNWAFSELLQQYLLDANGIIAVVPQRIPESNNEYIKPVAMFFESDQIIDFAEGEYIVLLSRDTSTYTTPSGKIVKTNGAIYYIITTTQVVKYEQINSNGELQATQIYDHNIGRLPAFKAGGLFYKRINNDTIFESRLAGMIPSLDEAAREYSDLQAEIVQHIHSEKYIYTNTECPDCNGTGKVRGKDGEISVCQKCNGTGSIASVSPYGIHTIAATRVGEMALPTPPIGYIQKSSEIARLQDERVRQHLYDALAAVNMEFLAETPLSQSGLAKEVDRDELNNFVNSIAEDIVRILDNVYYFINEYRYKIIVPNDETRTAMLPHINVPTKYDLLNTQFLLAEIKTAKESNLNPMIVRSMEIEYTRKQFNTDPKVADLVETIFDLDPLFGVTEDAKMTMLSNGGITEKDYIISCNINKFVRNAVNKDQFFFEKTFEQKTKIIEKMAEEVIRANEEKQMNNLLPQDLNGLMNALKPQNNDELQQDEQPQKEEIENNGNKQ